MMENNTQASEPVRDREADRQRFPDVEFNRWLDEGISDAGHTVWDSLNDVCDAWHGWNNRQYYPTTPQPAADKNQLLYSAQTTAEYLAKKFYPQVTQWKVLDDLEGALSQINNMVTGIPQPASPCPRCDGTGDVSNQIGEYLGHCDCGAPSQFKAEMQEITITELQARCAELELERDKWKINSESLARTVMLDSVSNDCVLSKDDFHEGDFIVVWKVTMTSGESCYFGIESLAKACARKTGKVDCVHLPRRKLELVDLATAQRFQKERTSYFNKLIAAEQQIASDKLLLDECEEVATGVIEACDAISYAFRKNKYNGLKELLTKLAARKSGA